ncbi:hypothetical protein BCR32DRAFT_285656 [Anaeromyces robustus]|uniref:MULE transposase domain-containing protein n=1 Tax=Anaeromyces robustus TaxID=1754192 RepID=A0A1Y1WJB9_9FUNG|nr:hypothetical protein BCR32DRAFT_285656 [Anaeromyces robustus]|eukprot:ORX73428.1 hypothetical protein BCR32DRAFT_285656 [Anaeromyces robustus]
MENLKIEFSETNKGKEQVVINRKYKFNLRLHNHSEKEFDVSISLVKHKIKDDIRKSSILFEIKPKRIFDEISEEIAEIFIKYNENIFADGTFYIAPIFSYQVLITRAYVPELNSFYNTSFSILNNKKQTTYETLFEEINKNLKKYSNNIIITPKHFHCDFEKVISNAIKKTFPNINIRYCVWHYKRSLEINKNKLSISNFPFINPNYIFDIHNKIKRECQENNYNQFLDFLEYFNDNYLQGYDIKYWNYYNGIEHITNNVSELYNKYLKLLFQNKPTFYKLIHKLKKESLSFNDYQRRNEGIWSKKRKIFRRTDQINILIGMYKEAESNLINNECNRNEIIELWFECLNILNSNFINLISI